MRSVLIVVLMVLATGASADDVPADSVARSAPDSLAPTSSVPWNPPHAMSPRSPWEQVVLFPGRLVSLPLSGLGYVARSSMLYVEDTGRLPIGPQVAHSRAPRIVAFQFPRLGDQPGPAAAVLARTPSSIRFIPFASARYAASLHSYNSTLVGASGGPVSLQYGYDWRPRQQFYGVGISSRRENATDYASQGEFVRGALRWGLGGDSTGVGQRLQLSAWGGPRSQVTRTGRGPGQTSYEVLFPELGAATLDRRVEHLIYGGSVLADWRSGRPHWSRGGRVLIGAERYDVPIRALALHSSQFSGAQFTRYSVETETGVSIMRDPRTVRLLLRLSDEAVGAGQDRLLISDMSRLGGHDGLGGYPPGRFHDLDLVLSRLMYVFPLERAFEVEIHAEWGAVYPDVWRDAKIRTLKHSVGFSLRGRTNAAPRGAVGFDFSPEGMRFNFALGGVE